MNPIIICQKLKNGVIEVPLVSSCRCHIGLVSISIPTIIRSNSKINTIFVSCDQVDATVTNPKRLLRAFGYDKNQSRQWTVYEFNTILYHRIDSSEKKLTLRIYDNDGNISPNDEKYNSDMVIIELNMIPAKQSQNL